MNRAQTSFDFAVGMGIFLLTVAFVLTFIPTIFQPFAVGSGGDEIVGDRVAATLAEDALVENVSQPNVLNASCTVKLFNDDDDPEAGCAYSEDDLGEVIGPTERNLNVTIRQDGEIATITADVGTTDLKEGPEPRSGADVTVSRRVVWIDGEVYQLWVKIW